MLNHIALYLAFLALAQLATVHGGVVVPFLGPSDHQFFPRPNTTLFGHNDTIGDLNVTTYVSLPKGRYDKEKAVVLLTDVFGFPKIDNLLLADHFAEAGFAVYTPDYLFGDSFPLDGDTNNIGPWLSNHTEAITTPLLLSVLDELKTKRGIKKIGVTGYCFGGLYVFRLSQNNTVQVTTTAHPSFLTIPEDAQLLLEQSQVPLQIHSGEFDSGLTPELAEEIDDVLVGNYEPGYNRTAWKGVYHGFATSYNESDPLSVAAYEGAFKSAVHWIRSHIDG